MKIAIGKFRAVSIAACLVAVGVAMDAQAATIKLKVVKVNSVPVAPTSTISASPGDILETEIYFAGWGTPDPTFLARSIQAGLDRSGYASGLCGNVLPVGWDGPVDPILCALPSVCAGGSNNGNICLNNAACPGGTCQFSSACPDEYPICFSGVCYGTTHNPGSGFFVNQSHPDYIFAGLGSIIVAVDTSSLDYRVGGLPLSPGGAVDDGGDAYFGTLLLEVMEGSGGTFNIGFLDFPSSIVKNQNDVDADLSFEPLSLTSTGECDIEPPDPCFIVSSDPPNCAIDARYPHAPANTIPAFGWNTFDLTMDPACDVESLAPSDFLVTVEGGAGAPPLLTTVVPMGNQVVRLTLAVVVRLERWTCVTLTSGVPGANKVCLGRLPGDANADRTAAPADILTVIDNLNGVVQPPLAIWQCDIDRSGVCAPADILGVIDLLNGASAFQVWNNRTIPIACPTQ